MLKEIIGTQYQELKKKKGQFDVFKNGNPTGDDPQSVDALRPARLDLSGILIGALALILRTVKQVGFVG